MSTLYTSPKYYRETLPQQNHRLEDELKQSRLQHALRIGRQSLRWLETRRICGETFTSLEAGVMMQTQCRMDGVSDEFIPAVVSLIVDAYNPKAA